MIRESARCGYRSNRRSSIGSPHPRFGRPLPTGEARSAPLAAQNPQHVLELDADLPDDLLRLRQIIARFVAL